MKFEDSRVPITKALKNTSGFQLKCHQWKPCGKPYYTISGIFKLNHQFSHLTLDKFNFGDFINLFNWEEKSCIYVLFQLLAFQV